MGVGAEAFELLVRRTIVNSRENRLHLQYGDQEKRGLSLRASYIVRLEAGEKQDQVARRRLLQGDGAGAALAVITVCDRVELGVIVGRDAVQALGNPVCGNAVRGILERHVGELYRVRAGLRRRLRNRQQFEGAVGKERAEVRVRAVCADVRQPDAPRSQPRFQLGHARRPAGVIFCIREETS